jgi:hypothetical protein
MAAIPKTIGAVSVWCENMSLLSIELFPLAVPGYRSDSFPSPRERLIFGSTFRCERGVVKEWRKKSKVADRSAPQMRLEGGF